MAPRKKSKRPLTPRPTSHTNSKGRVRSSAMPPMPKAPRPRPASAAERAMNDLLGHQDKRRNVFGGGK